MGFDAEGRRTTVTYGVRTTDETVVVSRAEPFTAVSAIDVSNSDGIRYVGYVLGLDAEFENVRLQMAIPRSLVDRAGLETDLSGGEGQLILDGGVLADVALTEVPLVGSPNQAVVGTLFHDDGVVDLVAIDDPFLLLAIVFGGMLVSCAYKFALTKGLLDRAFQRATEAGNRPTLVIETSTDGATSVGAAGRLRAKLGCQVRGVVRSGAGEFVEEYSEGESSTPR